MPPAQGNRIRQLLTELETTPLSSEQVALMQTFVTNVRREQQQSDAGSQQDSELD
jgi:hypothetical protein